MATKKNADAVPILVESDEEEGTEPNYMEFAEAEDSLRDSDYCSEDSSDGGGDEEERDPSFHLPGSSSSSYSDSSDEEDVSSSSPPAKKMKKKLPSLPLSPPLAISPAAVTMSTTSVEEDSVPSHPPQTEEEEEEKDKAVEIDSPRSPAEISESNVRNILTLARIFQVAPRIAAWVAWSKKCDPAQPSWSWETEDKRVRGLPLCEQAKLFEKLVDEALKDGETLKVILALFDSCVLARQYFVVEIMKAHSGDLTEVVRIGMKLGLAGTLGTVRDVIGGTRTELNTRLSEILREAEAEAVRNDPGDDLTPDARSNYLVWVNLCTNVRAILHETWKSPGYKWDAKKCIHPLIVVNHDKYRSEACKWVAAGRIDVVNSICALAGKPVPPVTLQDILDDKGDTAPDSDDFDCANVLYRCCGSGSLTGISWLVANHLVSGHVVTDSRSLAIEICFVHGHCDAGLMLIEAFGPHPERLAMADNRLLAWACKSGDTSAVDKLAGHLGTLGEKTCSLRSFVDACRRGDLRMAKWIAQRFNYESEDLRIRTPSGKRITRDPFHEAVKLGREAVVHWLGNTFEITLADVALGSFEAVTDALREARTSPPHRNILRWMVNKFGLLNILCGKKTSNRKKVLEEELKDAFLQLQREFKRHRSSWMRCCVDDEDYLLDTLKPEGLCTLNLVAWLRDIMAGKHLRILSDPRKSTRKRPRRNVTKKTAASATRGDEGGANPGSPPGPGPVTGDRVLRSRRRRKSTLSTQ